MAKKQVKSYIVKVWGESESDWSGAQAADIQPLLSSQSNKNTAGLEYDIAKTQIELALNSGNVAEANKALETYKVKCQQQYQAPLNVFPRDRQNGQAPYIGAHSLFGGFRDCANYMFPKFFYQKGVVGGTKAPSKKHLRKAVSIKPHHVFLYRGDVKIAEIDEVEGQQPVGEVKGFARYEVLRHPFKFSFKMLLCTTNTLFSEFLGDKEKVVECLYQSSFHGQGGRRGAGYGEWKVTKHEIQDTP